MKSNSQKLLDRIKASGLTAHQILVVGEEYGGKVIYRQERMFPVDGALWAALEFQDGSWLNITKGHVFSFFKTPNGTGFDQFPEPTGSSLY